VLVKRTSAVAVVEVLQLINDSWANFQGAERWLFTFGKEGNVEVVSLRRTVACFAKWAVLTKTYERPLS
jgi:hypothetical protein